MEIWMLLRLHDAVGGGRVRGESPSRGRRRLVIGRGRHKESNGRDRLAGSCVLEQSHGPCILGF